MGGSWQQIERSCDVPMELPSVPYELVAVWYLPRKNDWPFAVVSFTKAGPGDMIDAHLLCTASYPSPTPTAPTEVNLVGAASAVFVGFGANGKDVAAPSTQLDLVPAASDLAAWTPTVPPAVKFVLERNMAYSSNGLTVDFNSAGQSVENRPISFQGLPMTQAEVETVFTMPSGVGTAFRSDGTVPADIQMIPISATMAGDREDLTASYSDMMTQAGSARLDLMQAGTGPIAITFPPSPELTAARTEYGVAFSSTATWSWNSLHAHFFRGSVGDELWDFTKLPGWPQSDLEFDFMNIPGWDSTWRTDYGFWNELTACDHEPTSEVCASQLNVPLAPGG